MCGICGFVANKKEAPIDQERLYRMTDILRHRGPDSRGFYLGPGVGLGMRRLSIIDLKTGDQPIYNEDKTIALVCNGEIYNYLELQKILVSRGHRLRTESDVEVIAHLYEDHGTECVKYLRGMFAFALWDLRKQRLMLCRDRFGIKPLHYAVGKDGFYFASEFKSILEAGQVDRSVDAAGLRDLFSLGFVASPKTLFSNIKRLLSGHYLIYKVGKFSTHCYWRPSFAEQKQINKNWSADDYTHAFLDKLKETVRIHLRSDVEVGAWLSPGIDSSSIVSLMARQLGKPVKTFTLRFESEEVDEAGRNRTLDEFGGLELDSYKITCSNKDLSLFPKALWYCEDVFTAGVELPRLVLSEFSSARVKTVLTGEGADEL